MGYPVGMANNPPTYDQLQTTIATLEWYRQYAHADRWQFERMLERLHGKLPRAARCDPSRPLAEPLTLAS